MYVNYVCGFVSGEAWVFHISAALNNKGAIWAAQRVPDDHVAVVANNFIIKCSSHNKIIIPNCQRNMSSFDTKTARNWPH